MKSKGYCLTVRTEHRPLSRKPRREHTFPRLLKATGGGVDRAATGQALRDRRTLTGSTLAFAKGRSVRGVDPPSPATDVQ